MFRKRRSTPATTNTNTNTTTTATNTTNTTTTGSDNRADGMPTAHIPRFYSNDSTWSIPDSCFHTHDFLLGASVVIIQPSSGKVVLVNDTQRHTWFLPRGRKDIGETLEQCALREAYEESGYRVEFLPLYLPSRAPAPPDRPSARNEPTVSEPVFITSEDFGRHRRNGDRGGQYITFCYVGQIPAGAVREESTGMPDEKHYVGTLLDIQDALRLLYDFEKHILRVSYILWQDTVEIEQKLLNREANYRPSHRSRHHSSRRATATEGSNSGPGASVGN